MPYTQSRAAWSAVHKRAPDLLHRAAAAAAGEPGLDEWLARVQVWARTRGALEATDAPSGVLGESTWEARRLLTAYARYCTDGGPLTMPPEVQVPEIDSWLAQNPVSAVDHPV